MSNQIPERFEEFERQLELLRKFGAQALKQKLQSENKQKGLTATVDRSLVADMFGSVINESLDSAFAKDLIKVQKGLEQQQTPRGDNRPELTNANQGVRPQAPNYKSAPWMAKMDTAADPKVNDALDAFAHNADPNAPLVTQFNDLVNKVENQLRNEYKMRMANKITPPAPRPTLKKES